MHTWLTPINHREGFIFPRYSWNCSCGSQGAVQFDTTKKARVDWQIHVDEAERAEARFQAFEEMGERYAAPSPSMVDAIAQAQDVTVDEVLGDLEACDCDADISPDMEHEPTCVVRLP